MNDAPPDFDPAFADQFDTLLRWRRDVRHFRTDPVPEAAMQALLATVSHAPSVGHAQPWRLVRVRSAGRRDRIAAHVDAQARAAADRYTDPAQRDCYHALKLHGLREAPEIMAVFSDDRPVAGHGLGIATMPEMLRYSTVMAVHGLWLAARARGIGLGWVSIVDPPALGAMLEVPADWTLIALLCIGYPAAPSDTPALEQHGWQAREPLADRLFDR
ncbi:5,6-dimethylbenzimidazole synthase [Sphingobium sp. HBC34]|uniref:5,6-dimethylbenzimidazole synthase n=1 Tax=Sphingobium cyanobacteriorum TaxID=3063954 RepID=A0ABT8ZQ46_9SPHN|nr:5,6-dimethylbenzimidazole synthase [Sphingobium sp. HBC34]MDO7836670.1 5,6-dimethylbenzimidazole synthase [Sphingobium sp. HBC34]